MSVAALVGGGGAAPVSGVVTQRIACCLVGVGAYGFYTALPVMLGVLATQKGFNSQQLGWLGSAQLLGMLLGSVSASVALRVGRHRVWAALGLGVVLLAHALTWWMQPFGLVVAALLLGGWGAGLAYSVSVAGMGLTPEPGKGFGYLNGTMVLAGSIELMGLPWVIGATRLAGALVVLSLLCGAALLSVFFLPVKTMSNPPLGAAIVGSGELQRTRQGGAVGLVLVAAVLFHVAPAAYWAYAEEVGALAGLAPDALGAVLTVGGLAGAGCCLLAWRVGERLGQRAALLACGAVLFLALFSWLLPLWGPAGFLVRTVVFFSVWASAGVYQLTSIAPIDGNGRVAALMPAAQGVGLSVGPFVAATLIESGMTLPTTLASCAVFLLFSMGASRLSGPLVRPSAELKGGRF